MTALRVFDDIARTNSKPARHDEGRFAFLNRSASDYFANVRDLIEDWFEHIPANHQAALRGALRADDDHSSSAIWELYLHEAYLRSGFEIEIHPDIPDVTTRPDFLVARGADRFYLEAVSVGRPQPEIAEDKRLDQVHQILTDMHIENFSIGLSTYGTGSRPLATRKLRNELRAWIASLDPDAVTQAALVQPGVGFAAVPKFAWDDDGWNLVFHAFPLVEAARGEPRRALGVMGPGRATGVDNVTGIRRVISSKRSKYGTLDSPLVIAVQSNTEYPTRDYEFEEALYGLASRRPAESAAHPSDLFKEGLWIGRSGWQNNDVPQVISVASLAPWSVTRTRPRCWSTLEPGVSLPNQPDWLAPMIVGAQSLPGDACSLSSHLGVPGDWPAAGDPDFDLS